jgi:DNA-binding response OmpR family regulator
VHNALSGLKRELTRGVYVARLRRVIVADDEPAMRLLCRINLESDGAEVIEATDGHAALALAREAPPDVVILDVMMPGANGFDVAEQLLRDPRTMNVPIVFLSARAELTLQLQGIELGGFDYLTKPFDAVALKETLERVLQRAAYGDADAYRAARLAELRSKMEPAERALAVSGGSA